jgi:hypothetical protein
MRFQGVNPGNGSKSAGCNWRSSGELVYRGTVSARHRLVPRDGICEFVANIPTLQTRRRPKCQDHLMHGLPEAEH